MAMSSSSSVDILFLSHRYDVKGGGEKALIELIAYLTKQGLHCHVIIGSKGNIITHLDQIGATYSEIYLPYWAHSQNDPSDFIFHSLNPTVSPLLQIVNLVQQINPRLCVTNTIVVPWLAYASSITGHTHAWMIHELGTAGLQLRYAIGEKETLHSIDELSDAIFYNSPYTASYYLPHFAHNREVRIVYPGGNIPKYRSTNFKTYKRGDSFRLVTVGQIKRQKAQMDTIKAVDVLIKEGYKVNLQLVGLFEETDYTEKIREYLSAHNLESVVKLVGFRNNVADYLQMADASVTSAVNESFGRSTVEAMLLGTPTISAASAGTLDVVDDPSIGLLYKPGDYIDLAAKIKTLINKPELRSKIKKMATKKALERYSDKKRFAEFMNYYFSLPSPPISHKALDLSLLNGLLYDFNHTVKMLEETQKALHKARHPARHAVSKLRKMVKDRRA